MESEKIIIKPVLTIISEDESREVRDAELKELQGVADAILAYYTGRTIQDVMMAQLNPELRVENIDQVANEETGEVTFSYELSPANVKGRICIEAIPSEDLAVSVDTKRLATAPYCCVRSRPRAQDLIAMGLDYDKVMSLPPYDDDGNNLVEIARDTVDEYTQILDVEAYGIMGQREG